MLRHAGVLFFCVAFSWLSCAQNPKEYSTVLYDHLITEGGYLIPAPAGWNAAFVGIRNNAKQQLATVDFYNDSLAVYAQTGIPQITIFDAAACADSTGAEALYLLTGDRKSFYVYRVDANRTVTRAASLAPGENLLTPKQTSLEFIGAIAPHDSVHAPSFLILAHLNDEPFRHVIALYGTDGNPLWQYAIGASAVHPFLATADSGANPMIYFSTDAAAHETADTIRFSAQKSAAGALALNGALEWTCLLGERGTTSWCMIARVGSRLALACAARNSDGGELFLLNPRSGITEHYKHVPGDLIPRTLCASEEGIVAAEPPDTLLQFDSTLKEISVSTILPVIDSASTIVDLPGGEGRHLLFSQTQSVILTSDLSITGFEQSGMLYSRAGIARFSGAPLRHSILFCAETSRGAALRTEASNKEWWWFRYRMPGGLFLGAIALFAAVFMASKKYFFYRTYYNQLVRSSTSTGIIALNRQQRVVHVNNAARDLLHIAPYIPLQRHLTEYLSNAVYADIVSITRECMQTRRSYEKIITVQEGVQTRTLLGRARPTISRGGLLAGCILQIEDITRTIDRERLLNWASVAHHIAHEMKTPIGTVLLNAQHLQKTEEEIPDKSRKYLQRIILQTDRLSSILQTFLRIARFNAMKFSTMNVAHLVQSLAAEYADLVPPNISITFTGAALDATTEIDNEQLTTALRNIIDNAVNAINPRQGTITVSVADRASSSGNFIVIAVRDNGKGMTETCKARLFEPFYTETPGGSGIGMMIVKRIVDEHKGFIEIESEEEKGTEIRVLLPRIAANER